MKTYSVDFRGPIEADGPHGAWVKTADHFEAVGELQSRIDELTKQLDQANMRHRGALSQLTALLEQLAKGVAVQAPGPVELKLGEPEWRVIHGEQFCRKCDHAMRYNRPFEFDGQLWIVEEWKEIRGLSVKINAKLRPIKSC